MAIRAVSDAAPFGTRCKAQQQHRGGEVLPCAMGVASRLVYVLLMGIPLQMRWNRRILVALLPILYLEGN